MPIQDANATHLSPLSLLFLQPGLASIESGYTTTGSGVITSRYSILAGPLGEYQRVTLSIHGIVDRLVTMAKGSNSSGRRALWWTLHDGDENPLALVFIVTCLLSMHAIIHCTP